MNGDVIAEFDRLLSYPYFEERSYTQCTKTGYLASGGSYYCHLEEITRVCVAFGFLGAAPNGLFCHDATFNNCDGLGSEMNPLCTADGHEHLVEPKSQFANYRGLQEFHKRRPENACRDTSYPGRTTHAASGGADEDDPGFVVKSQVSMFGTVASLGIKIKSGWMVTSRKSLGMIG